MARIRAASGIVQAIREHGGDDPAAMQRAALDLFLARLCEVASEREVDAKSLQQLGRTLQDNLKSLDLLESRTARSSNDSDSQRGATAASLWMADLMIMGEARGVPKEIIEELEGILMPQP